MGTIIRSTDRVDSVTRLPAETGTHGKSETRAKPTMTPEVPPAPVAYSPPKPDPEIAHLGAVAAATLGEPAPASLLDRALRTAQLGAEREIEKLREEAQREGHRIGLEQGQREAQTVLAEKLSRVEAIAQELQALRDQILQDAEDKLVELVFEATTRILGGALATPDGVAAVVRQVLANAREQTKVLTIRVAPFDYELLGGSDDEPPKPLHPGVAIVPDARVQLGGCLLDTAQGSIDGRLEIQLERLKNAVLDARHGRKP